MSCSTSDASLLEPVAALLKALEAANIAHNVSVDDHPKCIDDCPGCVVEEAVSDVALVYQQARG